MADSKVTALTADTTVDSADLGYTIEDPGGTPVSKKATWLNILKGAALGVLTADGDLFTRTSGALARITRASLAADSAFSSLYAAKAYGTFVRKVLQTLTDKTSFAGTTDEQWGTEEATLDDALLPITTGVVVTARLTGYMNLLTSNSNLFYYVEISLDGGSTWTAGQEQWYRFDASVNSDRFSMNAVHQRTGTVTGDIQARVMARQSTGATYDGDLSSGSIELTVIATP